MTYMLAALAGIVAAVVGWFVTSVVAVWVAGLCGMSDFEGGRGMFAFLGVGPIGGLISMVLAVWLVLASGRAHAPFGPILLRLVAVLAGIAVLVAAAIWIRLSTIDTYSNILPPTLEFELRLPAGVSRPPRDALRVEVHTDKNVGDGTLFDDWTVGADGIAVIRGSVPLAFKRPSRLLVVTIPGQPTRLFNLLLPRDPPASAEFGAWHRTDYIDDGTYDRPHPAPADDPLELRQRVQRSDEVAP